MFAGWYPQNEVSREAGAMRGASRSGAGRTFYFNKSPTASEMASAMRSWPADEG